MKTTFKMLVLALVALFATSVSDLNANNNNSASEQHSPSNCGVSDAQIINFMSAEGYQVLTVTKIEGSCNVVVSVIGGKKFMLFIEGNSIRDYEEVLS